MFGEYGWGTHPNQDLTIFVKQSKTHEAAYFPDETRQLSDSLILDVFVQLLSLIRLIASNAFQNLSSGCLVGAHNKNVICNM